MKQRFFFLFFLVTLSTTGWAQISGQMPGGVPGGFGGRQAQPNSATGATGNGIIDDSTKVIYGPRTTRYVLEEDIFNNRRKLYTTDTTMDDTHQFTYVQRSQNMYQDLGALGTPMRPTFLQVPQQLGGQSGYTVFSPYAFQTMGVKYFDTKSPFTDMYLALGGRDQNILRFSFAQNVTPRWNVGFNVQRFTAQKEFGTSGTNDTYKLLTQNWGLLLHTNYRSKNDKYTLLAHFNNMNHSLDEQGGVLPGRTAEGVPIILNYTGDSRLRGGSSPTVYRPHGWEIRNDWHLYHQYVLDNGFQLYHRLDYKTQKNLYQDDTLSLNQSVTYPGEVATTTFPLGDANKFISKPTVVLTEGTVTRRFYPAILGDTSRIQQLTRFRVLENQFGLKGIAQYKGAAFTYRAYLRIRNYVQHTQYNVSRTNYSEYETPRFESFVGGWLGYYFPDSLSQVTVEAEIGSRGSYRIQGQLDSKFLTVGGSIQAVEPTLLQERFRSKVYVWPDVTKGLNPLTLRNYYHAFGKLNVRYKNLRLQPGLDFFLVKNYVYFDTEGVVRQETSPISQFRTGLGYQLPFGKFLVSGQAYYTHQIGPDVIRIPPFFMNARFQYEFLYAKVLYIQTGVELHYKSPYYADAYMPLTQQFYLQNRQRVEGYVLADVFANLRINRTRLFVKLTHANVGPPTSGYFVAPDYLQMRRSFSFGVDWYLFD